MKLSSQPEYAENPFIEKAINEIQTVKKTQVVRSRDRREINMIVNHNGEIAGQTQFLRFVEVDEERFAKIYISQFAAFWELSKPAIRVFGYILTILEPKKDSFFFNMDECLKHTQYATTKNIFLGLSNLIDCGIIARSPLSYKYFINPLVVFNGDRVSFTQTYVKKKKAENPNQRSIFDEIELPNPETEPNKLK